MIDCPCGYGKQLKADQKSCPICGTDLTPLHRLQAVPQSYYQQGVTLASQGDLEGAIAKLYAAIALDPLLSSGYLTLGDLLAKKGEYNNALIQFEKACSLAINPQEEENINQKIKDIKLLIKKEREKENRYKKLLVILPLTAFLLGAVLVPQVIDKGKKEPAADISAMAVKARNKLAATPVLNGITLEVGSVNNELAVSGQVPGEVYRDLVAEIVMNTAGKESVNLDRLSVVEKEKEIIYTVKAGDCLAAIAARIYGNGAMWEKIYAANRDVILDPNKIITGLNLRIPTNK